jgi:hypothetical protein
MAETLREALDHTPPPPESLSLMEAMLTDIPEEDIEVNELDQSMVYKYKGDFNGLLRSLYVSKEAIYLTCLLNGIRSPTSFNGKMKSIRLLQGDLMLNLVAVSQDWNLYLKRSRERDFEIQNPTYQ